MKHISIGSSWWDESNRAKNIGFQSLDSKIISKMSKTFNSDNTVNIDAIDTILLPFDSPKLELSYELQIIKFWSLEAEMSLKMLLLFFYNNYR